MRQAAEWHLELDRIPDDANFEALARTAYEQTCRTNLDRPGFFLISVARTDAWELRRAMMVLKGTMDQLHREHRGQSLHYLSMGRFDQQVTTRFHLDGAPPESFLMLGYEPTVVESRLLMADYTRCARDLGMTPDRFLDELNPMFAPGEEKLRGYVTELTGFDGARFHILLINNSHLPVTERPSGLLGVLHKAEILTPRPEEHRWVNSTMIFAAELHEPEQIGDDAQLEWVTSGTSAGMARY